MESVQIAVKTSDNTLAIGRSNTIAFCGNGSISSSCSLLPLAANYDYIPVSYTLTFGPSYQSEQCIKIQIINDSLAEGYERFTVQLTTNSSAINITTSQFNIYIEPNNGTHYVLTVSHSHDNAFL